MLHSSTSALLSTKHGMAVGLASTGSALVIVSSLIMAGVIFHDINSLYFEIMQEMEGFKSIANDAWHEMMLVQGQQPSGLKSNVNPILEFSSMLVREKRGGYSTGGYAKPQQCNCAPQANRCPSGPPGIPDMFLQFISPFLHFQSI